MLAITLLVFPWRGGFVFADNLKYKVREGDTPGGILDSIGICPLWGTGNSVEKFLELNSSTSDTSQRSLKVGEELILPIEKLPFTRRGVSVNNSGYVYIDEGSTSNCTEKAKVRYKFREGDSVGSILDTLGVCPLWGPGNSVHETLVLNKKDPSRLGSDIHAGTWIEIPISAEDILPGDSFTIDSDGILKITNSNRVSRCSKDADETFHAKRSGSQTPSPIVEATGPSARPREEQSQLPVGLNRSDTIADGPTPSEHEVERTPASAIISSEEGEEAGAGSLAPRSEQVPSVTTVTPSVSVTPTPVAVVTAAPESPIPTAPAREVPLASAATPAPRSSPSPIAMDSPTPEPTPESVGVLAPISIATPTAPIVIASPPAPLISATPTAVAPQQKALAPELIPVTAPVAVASPSAPPALPPVAVAPPAPVAPAPAAIAAPPNAAASAPMIIASPPAPLASPPVVETPQARVVAAPPVTPVPPAAQEEEEIPASIRFSFGVSTGFSAVFGTAVDNASTAQFASDLNTGGVIRAEMDWAYHYLTRFEVAGNNQKFLDIAGRPLLDSQLTYYSLTASQGFKLPWGFTPSVIASFAQKPGYHSADETTFQFDRILTPYVGASLRKSLVNSRRFDLDVEATYLSSMEVSTPEYNVQTGAEIRYGAQFGFKTQSGFKISSEIVYSSELQPNTILELDRKVIELRMIFSLPELK